MDKIHVELTADELERICSHLAGLLESDMPAGTEYQSYAHVIASWRIHRAEYVRFTVGNRIREGSDTSPETIEWIEECRDDNDATADLLEKLSQLLPEAAHA